MTDMGPPLQSPGRTPRRTDPGVDGRHRASLMIVLLGICGHLAATASVVLAVMGLMRLFDLLADRLQDPALAGIVTGLAAVLLIAAVGMLGLAAVRHRRTFSARMIAALDRHEGLRRARIRLGFALAVGVRAVLLLGAASLPVTALAISPPRDQPVGGSAVTVYALLALAYLILAPLVAVRVRRGLARLRARRDHALRAICARR